ncbi:MAG: hypothetical protein SFV19_20010 [Rhodospirillaceae bacterium]|nr:hypothetical protein [Rhodospirillaceae bacterium]
MSDDIPIIFTQAPAMAVFCSASGAAQMQQYAAAGWRVATTPDFRSARPVDLSQVPAEVLANEDFAGAAVLSAEGPHWSDGDAARVTRIKPGVVKVNCAFHDMPTSRIAAIAAQLSALGLTVVGAHWRDDNTHRIRALHRIDYLSGFEPPEWPRLNFIACASDGIAKAIINIGRLHAGQEQRIAQLRLSEAIRNDHIARLEAALVAAQQSPHFKLSSS